MVFRMNLPQSIVINVSHRCAVTVSVVITLFSPSVFRQFIPAVTVAVEAWAPAGFFSRGRQISGQGTKVPQRVQG